MKRVLSLFLIASAIFISSCSKDNTNSDVPLTPADYGYIPFYPGNYWIYQQYKIDTLGNETLLDAYDSVVITGTKNISTKTYMVFEGTWMSGGDLLDTLFLLRDSSGYYVDPTGKIHMADNNFTDTLFNFVGLNNHTGDTLYQSWYKMETEPEEVVVDAGAFSTVNYRGTILTHNPNQGVEETRYKDQLYSRNTGQVLDTYFYLGSPIRFERRLVRYYIDKNSSVY